MDEFLNEFCLVASIFIIIFGLMLLFPPKNINKLYGYRTPQSMESQEKWDFAQRYSSKLMLYSGLGLMLLNILFTSFTFEKKTELLVVLVLAIIAIVIWRTEKALKENF